MKIEIRNRYSGAVQLTCNIECDDTTPIFTKIGMAVRWAIKNNADLTGADLRRADLTAAVLTGADLKGADLKGADLTAAVLTAAVLTGAVLKAADLRRADLTAAENVPVIPNIHQVVYAAATPPGALEMSQWHTCSTTHCRAGWVVALAGEAGAMLESQLGDNTSLAAIMIYMASDPTMERIPDFYCDRETALKDMMRAAEREQGSSAT